MTETDLIDAVNERASLDPEFFRRLQEAVANKDFDQTRELIELVIMHSRQTVVTTSIDTVIAWFCD